MDTQMYVKHRFFHSAAEGWWVERRPGAPVFRILYPSQQTSELSSAYTPYDLSPMIYGQI